MRSMFIHVVVTMCFGKQKPVLLDNLGALTVEKCLPILKFTMVCKYVYIYIYPAKKGVLKQVKQGF